MIRSGEVAFYDALGPLMVDIDTVQPHRQNYNNGDVDEVMESIRLNGMYRPVIVDKETGYILAGNTTWEACKSMGSQIIPIVQAEPDTEATGYRIMVGDNEIARLAMPESASIVSLLEAIQKSSPEGLAGTGKTERDLESLKALAQIGLDQGDFAQWPMLTFRVPPHVKKAFNHMTREANDDRERFEIIMRLAGWDGT